MVRRVIGLGVGALLLSSCIVGETRGAGMVTNTSAALEGRLGSTGDGTGDYWFEYGPTTDYGQSTPRSSSAVVAGQWAEVSEEVAGLEPGATYHFRLCGRSAANQGTCGPDKTVTTGVARGRVRGSWFSFDPGPLPSMWRNEGLDLDLVGDRDGGPYRDGNINWYGSVQPTPTGSRFDWGGEVPPDCLRIEGNRATVGLYYEHPYYGPGSVTFIIEDNGPTGDRLFMEHNLAVLCPDPASAGGFDVGPGDFTVEGG